MCTLAAVLLWAGVAALAVASPRILRAWSVRPAAPGAGTASLSVVIAARDEAPRIGAMIESLRGQDHPNFEIIIVDDRSRDGTGAAADRAAAGDPRIRILRVDQRPPGWQGRLYAQGVGARAAHGDWMVFLSADQRVTRSDLLRSLVIEYERRNVAAVTVVGPFVGEHWFHRWAFELIVNNPVFWGVVFALQGASRRSVWLIGALGMRRATYRELGGVEAAAGCAAGGYDDHGWARALSSRGLRGVMLYAPPLTDVSNWEDFRSFWAGIRRWGAGLFTYRRGGWLVAATSSVLIGLVIVATAEVVVALSRGEAPGLAALALAAIGPTIGFAHCRWNRKPWWAGVAFVGVGVLALALVGGSAWVRLRNRVHWRDDEMRVVCPPPAPESAPAPVSRSESAP